MDFNRAYQMSRAVQLIKDAKAILDEIAPEERKVYDELLIQAPNAPNIKEFESNAGDLEMANDCLTDSLEWLARVAVPNR